MYKILNHFPYKPQLNEEDSHFNMFYYQDYGNIKK